MRYVLILAMIIGGALGGVLVYGNLTAGPPVVLAAPQGLRAVAGGSVLQPNGWTNTRSVTLRAGKPATSMGMDVEVRRAGQPFRGTPTAMLNSAGPVASTCQGCTAAVPSMRISLRNGAYRWQARLHNGQGVSPWVAYRGTINVDTVVPVVSGLVSPTDPKPGTTYKSPNMRFDWTGRDRGAGVAGYSYRLDTNPNGEARTAVRTASNTVTLRGLDTGQYYFHVRALDQAGNWGRTVTFPVRIDVTPPGLKHVRFNRFQFDPLYSRLGVSFDVTRPAATVRVGFYRQSDGYLTRMYVLRNVKPGQTQTVNWDGKGTRGGYVSSGQYAVYIRAIDRYGRSTLDGWRDLTLNYKRIVISLSQQKLWAYDGNNLFLSTLVTTGNRKLPTPTGVFQILGHFSPFTFRSPWPKSSPYYYPPSKSNYAMLFDTDGYFIHDAPWRTVFGPGSNAQLGTPGGNYTGSHGCVNVPPAPAQRLYAWAANGTTVVIKP